MLKKLVLVIAVLLWVPALSAAAPQKMNYQGFLTNPEGTPINGTKQIVFRIYDQITGGTLLWTETQPALPVTNGVLNVVLGSVNPINSSSQSLFRGTLYLSLEVNGEVLSPRRELTGAPYALASHKVLYGRVLTVAQEGGDAATVYAALQMIGGMAPTPSGSDPYIIEVKAGVYSETNSITLPDYVSLKGSGENATVINLSSGCMLTIGSGVSVEDLTINLQASNCTIAMANATNSHLRRCTISGPSYPYYVSMQGSVNCSFTDNHLRYSGSGTVLYFLYIQTAQKAAIRNNLIDITGATGATAIYAANITECVIQGNTINLRGSTDGSRGIQINNNYNSSRVSNNIFMGELATPAASDIYHTGTSGYPARPPHTGPYGIANHGSSGSELPAF